MGSRKLHLLSPLVLTVTTLEISRFQAPERHHPNLRRFKIFQKLVLRLQNIQLNDSLAKRLRLTSRLTSLETANHFQILILRSANSRKGVLNLTMQSQKLLIVPGNRNGEALSTHFFTKKSQPYLKSKAVTLAPPVLLFLDFLFSNLKFFCWWVIWFTFPYVSHYILLSYSNYMALYSACLRQKQKVQLCKLIIKINESRYNALHVASGSIKKLSSIDCINVTRFRSQQGHYAFQQIFSMGGASWTLYPSKENKSYEQRV